MNKIADTTNIIKKCEKRVIELIPSTKLPTSLEKFITFFEDKLKQIPEKNRESSKVWVPVSDSEGVEIYYTRMETDTEAENRIKFFETNIAEIEERELKELARLKKKYENYKTR